jgi:hypothetical protein
MKCKSWSLCCSFCVLALSSCISQLALAASDTGTLTVGVLTLRCGSTSGYIVSGFVADDVGSYSPTGLTGGATVVEVFDQFAIPQLCTGSISTFGASGFSSNPGKAWLSSVTCNGVAKPGSSASVYSYNNGEAFWTWNTLFGLTGKGGDNISCTIVHS